MPMVRTPKGCPPISTYDPQTVETLLEVYGDQRSPKQQENAAHVRRVLEEGPAAFAMKIRQRLEKKAD